jgi:SAM-dependent methyltransferase
MPMYRQAAPIYDALSRHKDYVSAAAAISQIVSGLVGPNASLLDVACGTGRHLEHLRTDFCVVGLDRSAEMLEVARQRCPGVELHVGDLRDFRINRQFDAVTCLFGSVAYAATPSELDRALQTMVEHLRVGGVLVIEPWLAPDRFVAGRLVFDIVDDADVKVARMYVTRCEGRVSVYEMDYLVATHDGVTHFTEEERLGLFTRDEYVSAFGRAGLTVLDCDSDLFGYGLFVGVRER